MAKPTIAVIAPGAMGAAVAARLAQKGADVVTSLAGRSEASTRRAAEAGMRSVGDTEVTKADIILSIVPPRDAVALAERLAPELRNSSGKGLYIDCNAISPETVKRVGTVVSATGFAFADGGVIGGPPRAGYDGPTLYVSGVAAQRVAMLSEHGLVVRVIEGPVGAASALKMSYAAITKGLTALASVSILAATRAGAAPALHAELAASQPALLAWLTRSVPDMLPKAYRFVGEMKEISSFTASDASREIYDGIANFYQQIADGVPVSGPDVHALSGFVGIKDQSPQTAR